MQPENTPEVHPAADKQARKAEIRQLKMQYRIARHALKAQHLSAKADYLAKRDAVLGKHRPHFKAVYTVGEELVSAITHGVGTLLSAAALVVMVVLSAQRADPWRVVSSAIFGATMILLYLMSTLYHALKPNRAKKVFQVFDHCSIYLLIAGTYTPYTLVTLRGGWGWTLFGIVWAAAILGVTFTSISLKRFKIFGVICYVAMGWVILVAVKPMLAAMLPAGLLLLFLGGVFYTLGILFYRDKKHRYMHSVWHFFVLAGSILHFFSVLGYVVMA